MTAVTITNWAGVAFHIYVAALIAAALLTERWVERRSRDRRP